MKPRYRVEIEATGFEYDVHKFIALFTTRYVRANSQRLAEEAALQLVRESTQREFEPSNKIDYRVDSTTLIRNPLKRSRPNAGSVLYDDLSSREEARNLNSEAGRGWW